MRKIVGLLSLCMMASVLCSVGCNNGSGGDAKVSTTPPAEAPSTAEPPPLPKL